MNVIIMEQYWISFTLKVLDIFSATTSGLSPSSQPHARDVAMETIFSFV